MIRPSGARWSSYSSISAFQARLVTSMTSWSRLEEFSSGANSRKLSMFCAITSRRKPPSTRVASTAPVPGSVDLDGVVAEVRHLQVAQQQAAVGVRRRAHPQRRRRGAAPRCRRPARRPRRTATRGRSCASTPRAPCGAPSSLARVRERHLVRAPEALDPLAVDLLGPVQPLGERSTIIGHGRRGTAPDDARASPWMSAISSRQRSRVPAKSACIWAGSEPATTYGACP